MMHRFRDDEIAKIFTVPANRVEPIEDRCFRDSELVRLSSVPARAPDLPLTHISDLGSPDPEIVMGTSKKRGEKE